MPTIRETEIFSDWMAKLRDQRAKAKIALRIDRLRGGNPGTVAAVGGGVSEMKIDYGPGYRVYFASRGKELVILLCGGDKSTQDRDIKSAKAIAAGL
jgi:putative addiction module killer protein